MVFSLAVYWIFGGIFLLMDLTLSPRLLRKYKVQPHTNEPVDKAILYDAIKVILFNQIAIGAPMAYISYYIKKLKGFPENFREVPSFEKVLLDLAVCILVDEIGFYYSHRLFHKKFFYKHIHKKHHLWQSPIAITATYCHPLEQILSNVLPVAGGSVIMQSHISVTWLWLAIATLTTLNNHSGYHLPFSHSSEFHDFHHLKWVKIFHDRDISQKKIFLTDLLSATANWVCSIDFITLTLSSVKRSTIPDTESYSHWSQLEKDFLMCRKSLSEKDSCSSGRLSLRCHWEIKFYWKWILITL